MSQFDPSALSAIGSSFSTYRFLAGIWLGSSESSAKVPKPLLALSILPSLGKRLYHL
jgi:hypothetical protein